MKNKKIILALILFFSWFIFSAAYVYSKSNLTVVTDYLPKNVLIKTTFSEFLKGEKITGEFTSSQNYLGQVLIRFYNYQRINSDSVIFRIKEKGQSNWYYENTYKTDQFVPNALFTFGFPIIGNSKGKTYYFEIESVKGKPEDAVTLSQDLPIAAVIYQFPKKELVKNPRVLSEYVKSKIKYTPINRDLLVNFITYLDFIFLILLLEYLLFCNLSISIAKFGKIKSSYFIITALVILALPILLFSLKKAEIGASISILSYFLLAIGTVLAFIEAKR